MTKDVKLRRIKTSIPDDVFVSSIDGILGPVKDVNLDVYFTSKKIYELENTMFVVLDMYDGTGVDMKALLVGNKVDHFISLVNGIKLKVKKYRISGNVSVPDGDDDAELPFMDDIKNSKVFFIYAVQWNPKPDDHPIKLARKEIERVRDGISIVQKSIIDTFRCGDCVNMFVLYFEHCFCGDDPYGTVDLSDSDNFTLNINQFYNLYVQPLINSKKIRIYNSKQGTKIPVEELELIYNDKE